MATVASTAERLVTLTGVSWETYERLLSEHNDSTGTRFTYDEETLEIMLASSRHEQPSRILAQLLEVIAEEFGVNLSPLGSVTFKRFALGKGFEPDSCHYVGRPSPVWGREVDPAVDAPPDLVIEVVRCASRRCLQPLPYFPAQRPQECRQRPLLPLRQTEGTDFRVQVRVAVPAPVVELDDVC